MEKSITKGNGLILLGLFVSLVIFFGMMIGVKNGSILSFDHYMQTLFDGCKSGILLFFERVSAMGSTLVIGVGSVLFLFWLWFKEKNYLAMVIFTVGVGGGNFLNKFVKNSMARPRPDGNLEVDSMSYSFPSGHAMVGLVFYVLLAYFITNEIKTRSIKWGIGLAVFVLMLLIGISRIGLNAHFTSDVIAGYALGATWSLVCVYTYRKKRKLQ